MVRGTVFTYSGDLTTPPYTCVLKSSVCEAISKSGQRCRRKVVIGKPYCYSHLLYQRHLRIKPSTLPGAGDGLFAVDPSTQDPNEVVFKKNVIIAPYGGERVTRDELERRYGDNTAPYGLLRSNNHIVDAACDRGVGSLPNTIIGTGRRNFNAKITNRSGNIVSTKPIRNGEEILVNYGRSYTFDGGMHRTKRK